MTTPQTPDALNQMAQQAFRHLGGGQPDLARPLVEALQRAAPGDRTVHALATQLAVISFPIPARRVPVAIEQTASVAQENIDLVTFHVDLPAAPSGIHEVVDYQAVLRLAFSAAALKAPKARRLILTDETTQFSTDIGAHEIIRRPMDLSIIMYERLRLQIAYLQDRAAGRASVLMDTDVVVNRDPCETFRRSFDIGLTWRQGFPDAPFNGGTIFVAPGSRGQDFLTGARACYDQLAATPAIAGRFDRSLKSWWGDQFALAAMAGYREFGQRQSDGLMVNDIKVAFLPCEDFNVTLEPQATYNLEDLRRKHFVHFKGNRKGMLAKYVELIQSGHI